LQGKLSVSAEHARPGIAFLWPWREIGGRDECNFVIDDNG
jgi:hypothetical protein